MSLIFRFYPSLGFSHTIITKFPRIRQNSLQISDMAYTSAQGYSGVFQNTIFLNIYCQSLIQLIVVLFKNNPRRTTILANQKVFFAIYLPCVDPQGVDVNHVIHCEFHLISISQGKRALLPENVTKKFSIKFLNDLPTNQKCWFRYSHVTLVGCAYVISFFLHSFLCQSISLFILSDFSPTGFFFIIDPMKDKSEYIRHPPKGECMYAYFCMHPWNDVAHKKRIGRQYGYLY